MYTNTTCNISACTATQTTSEALSSLPSASVTAPQVFNNRQVSLTFSGRISLLLKAADKLDEEKTEFKDKTQSPQRKIFECEIEGCGKTYKTKQGYDQHQLIHNKSGSFSCDYCEKTFSWWSRFIQHERIHTGEKPYECEKCRKTFVRKGDLKRHKSIHTGEKPYQCPHCNKNFRLKNTVKQHIKNIHKAIGTNKSGSIACKYCDKTFLWHSSFIRHESIHTGAKPYGCDQCRKTFVLKGDLKRHKSIHTGQRPYQCPICEQKFTQKWSATRHINTVHKSLEAVPTKTPNLLQSD